MSTVSTARKTALYRHISADGELLYVGIALTPVERMRDHKKGSRWFEQVATVTLEWFDTRALALAAEAAAIKAERPVYNKTHSGRLPRKIFEQLMNSPAAREYEARTAAFKLLAHYLGEPV